MRCDAARGIPCDAGVAREALRALRFCCEKHSVRCFQIARNAFRAKDACAARLQGKDCAGPRAVQAHAEPGCGPQESFASLGMTE